MAVGPGGGVTSDGRPWTGEAIRDAEPAIFVLCALLVCGLLGRFYAPMKGVALNELLDSWWMGNTDAAGGAEHQQRMGRRGAAAEGGLRREPTAQELAMEGTTVTRHRRADAAREQREGAAREVRERDFHGENNEIDAARRRFAAGLAGPEQTQVFTAAEIATLERLEQHAAARAASGDEEADIEQAVARQPPPVAPPAFVFGLGGGGAAAGGGRVGGGASEVSLNPLSEEGGGEEGGWQTMAPTTASR